MRHGAKCLKCEKFTGHRSQLCLEHRQTVCPKCGVKFASSKLLTRFCADCVRSVKLETKRMAWRS